MNELERGMTQPALEVIEEIRAILVDALGDEDGIPERVTTVYLAHAVRSRLGGYTVSLADAARSQLGGYRTRLEAAGQACGQLAAQLTEAIDEHGVADPQVVAVRDALLRHSRELS